MKLGFPASLKVTVPIVLLGFAATLSTVNLLYHVPKAERAAEEDGRQRLSQEMSRLQSTLEYLLLKGDGEAAQHEITVLAHNHDVTFAAFTDESGAVTTATRRASLGRPIAQVLPQFDLSEAAGAADRGTGMIIQSNGIELLGRAGILLGHDLRELRPTRSGSVFLIYDLSRYKAEARAQVIEQSLYWAGWVTALALAMWLIFHFLLTRRTAWLVDAAERFASGNLTALSGLRGRDELGRLSRAFDAMALEIAETQTRLRQDIAERTRVQRELESSEARLQQVLNNAPAIVSVKDTQGRFLFVNREWERVFQRTQDEVVGKTNAITLPQPIVDAVRANDAEVLERNEAMQFEESAPLRDGEHTYLSVKFPLHDASGQAYAVCSISTDITSRKRAAEALRVSEASYRTIFNAAEDAIFVHDARTGAIVDVNAKACATFGYTRDEFRGIDVGRLGSGEHPYTQHEAMALIARAAGGEPMLIEWHGKTKSGELRWHEVYVKGVTIGGVPRVLALARDITARKSAEAALRSSEEQYHAMFSASIDGLALWDSNGEMVDANPALWHMYGYDGFGRHGPPPTDFGPCYHLDFLQAVAAGGPLHTEVSDCRRDGSRLEVEVHGIPMQYQGKPHVLTIARDVTEKKASAEELARQREALHQREKLAALGSLLAGVAHELNNPLSVVVARAVLLEEQGDPATRTAALKIRSAAERCSRIVRTFLAMARQQQPQRGPVVIADVVGAAIDIAGYAIRTSSIDLSLDLAPDVPLVRADADQLHQVLLNLLINAQQALQDRPLPRRITVKTRHDRATGVVRIAVRDNGPGIPAPLRTRIFEPYFTTKPTGMGLGVGLAVSLGIVEAHGGTLTVDCPHEGGTVFTISLPVGEVEEPDHEADAATALRGAAGSVLVVDDEPEIRDTLNDILTGARHRVVCVASGREALKRMGSDDYDVILTDIRMADLDGRGLYQEILQRWPARATRVVFVTGDTLASDLREFVSRSGRPIIEKPFVPHEVRRVVAQLAANAR